MSWRYRGITVYLQGWHTFINKYRSSPGQTITGPRLVQFAVVFNPQVNKHPKWKDHNTSYRYALAGFDLFGCDWIKRELPARCCRRWGRMTVRCVFDEWSRSPPWLWRMDGLKVQGSGEMYPLCRLGIGRRWFIFSITSPRMISLLCVSGHSRRWELGRSTESPRWEACRIRRCTALCCCLDIDYKMQWEDKVTTDLFMSLLQMILFRLNRILLIAFLLQNQKIFKNFASLVFFPRAFWLRLLITNFINIKEMLFTICSLRHTCACSGISIVLQTVVTAALFSESLLFITRIVYMHI